VKAGGYIHSANEPHLIAGVATYAQEIFDQVSDRVSVRADAFTRSWRGPERVTSELAATFAEGVATRVTYDLTFLILKQ
jgi:threonine dehydratase